MTLNLPSRWLGFWFFWSFKWKYQRFCKEQGVQPSKTFPGVQQEQIFLHALPSVGSTLSVQCLVNSYSLGDNSRANLYALAQILGPLNWVTRGFWKTLMLTVSGRARIFNKVMLCTRNCALNTWFHLVFTTAFFSLSLFSFLPFFFFLSFLSFTSFISLPSFLPPFLSIFLFLISRQELEDLAWASNVY